MAKVELVRYLSEVCTEGEYDTEFLICEIGERATIHVLKNQTYLVSNAGWIGDHDAFSVFQKSLRNELQHTAGDDLRQRMLTAMIMLAHSDAHPELDTIGDHAIAVTTTERGFLYSSYFVAFPVNLIGAEKSAVNNAERGGYAESIQVPKEPGIGAIAVHIFPGNVGSTLAILAVSQGANCLKNYGGGKLEGVRKPERRNLTPR